MESHLEENEVFDMIQGVLTPEAFALVQQHIGECGACRELVAETARACGTASQPAPAPRSPASGSEVRIVVRDGKVFHRPTRQRPPMPEPMDPPPALSPGAEIAGRYVLDRRLGEGGSGVVWAATHEPTRRPVALKFLKSARTDAVKRFLREARVTSSIGHPNIVDVHDVFLLPDGAVPVMVMDLLEGESLGARLRRVGKMTARETSRLLLPVVNALGATHALGIVHRDLKPENVFLVGPIGAPIDVRVLDFGLAKLTATEGKFVDTSRLTKTDVVVGTPHYLAPEQISRDLSLDHRVDVWALGVALFECVSGKRPFDAQGLPELLAGIAAARTPDLGDFAPEAPRPLADLVRRILSRAPDARPPLVEIHDVLVSTATA